METLFRLYYGNIVWIIVFIINLLKLEHEINSVGNWKSISEIVLYLHSIFYSLYSYHYSYIVFIVFLLLFLYCTRCILIIFFILYSLYSYSSCSLCSSYLIICHSRTIVVAKVQQTEVGTPLVDIEKIRKTLAANGVGIIGGAGGTNVSIMYNGYGNTTKLPIDGVFHDGGSSAETHVNKTIASVREEVVSKRLLPYRFQFIAPSILFSNSHAFRRSSSSSAISPA